jgi:ArsR family transcriptional regulator
VAVDLGRFFDVLAHPVRLRIVGLVALEGRTVEELARLLEMKPALVFRHLARLRDLGLVRAERQGPRVRYGLEDRVLKSGRVVTSRWGRRLC